MNTIKCASQKKLKKEKNSINSFSKRFFGYLQSLLLISTLSAINGLDEETMIAPQFVYAIVNMAACSIHLDDCLFHSPRFQIVIMK